MEAALKFFKRKKIQTGFLPHPRETVLPELVHDEARSVGKVLDRDAVEEIKQVEGGRGGWLCGGEGRWE